LGNGRNTGNAVLKRLIGLKSPIDETVNDVIAVISTASIELSQIFTHVVNYYIAPSPPGLLDRDYDEKMEVYNTKLELQGKIVALASQPTADSPEQLAGYVREALRLDPVVEGVYRDATVAKDYGYLKYNKGEKLWFDYRAAGLNSSMFAEPQNVDPTRPAESYKSLQGDTVFKVLGADFVYGATANVLRAVFSLPNIKRAHGAAGTLRRFKDVFIAPNDDLLGAIVADPKIVLGDDGEPISGEAFPERPAESEFAPIDPEKKLTKDEMYVYGWKSNRVEDWDKATDEAPINTAWKYQYANPEDSHRLTPWATGLTLNYSV
jgi:hypothetical protein